MNKINEDLTPLRKIYSDLDKKFPKHNPNKISDVNKIVKFLGRKLKPGSQIPQLIASFYNDYKSGEDISKNQKRFFKYTKKMSKKEKVFESLLLEFDKYRLGGLFDSKLKKRLERTIKIIGGKVDAVGDDYVKFRISSMDLAKLPSVIKKLDRNKNVWIGDKRNKNIWDRKRNIDKLGEGFGGELKGRDKQKFEKARKENAEQLGYELTGIADIKEFILKETPAASAAAAMAAIQVQNAQGKKIKGTSALQSSDPRVQKKAKGIFKRLKDKFAKGKGKRDFEKQKKAIAKGADDYIRKLDKESVNEINFSKISTAELVRQYKQMADERLFGAGALTFRLIAKELIKRKARLESVNEKVVKVSKKDDVPGNPMKMSGEEKIKKLEDNSD